MKITENNYQLAEIAAIQVFSTATSGANKPLFIQGRDINTQKSNRYVLKYRGAERMDERTSARELLAALLAKELGIFVPEPVVILVNDIFVNGLKDHTDYYNIIKSKGINFGCEFVVGDSDMSQKTHLTAVQLQQAMQVFVFDLMIQNADRRLEKPNFFIAKDNIYIIDHELGFGFLDTFAFLRSSKPFIFNETDVNSAKNHFFYTKLRNIREQNFDAAFLPFEQFNRNFWNCIDAIIPVEWQTNEIPQIKTHINQILDNIHLFKQEIWTKLLNQ